MLDDLHDLQIPLRGPRAWARATAAIAQASRRRAFELHSAPVMTAHISWSGAELAWFVG